MNNRIVIVGGMGPQANIELHKKIIDKAAELGAHEGDEFPEVLNISVPIADFISDQNRTVRAKSEIVARLRCLYPAWRQDSARM